MAHSSYHLVFLSVDHILDIHPSVRVVAMPRARVTPPVRVSIGMMSPAPNMCLLVVAKTAPMEEGGYSRNEEQDDIDDAKCKARLEHSTPLIRLPVDIHTRSRHGDLADVDGPVVGGGGDVGAVGRGDAAQEVDGGDEGAEEEGVDEGDKVGVARGAGVGEEGEEGPGEGEGGDDEEDEDGVGGEGVDVVVALDKPGEHAHHGDLFLLAGMSSQKGESRVVEEREREGRMEDVPESRSDQSGWI